MHLGDLELLPLSDGTFRLDGGAMFGVVPRVLWERRASPDERHRIPLALRPMLVRAGGKNLLIDAGIGDKLGAKERQIYGVDRTEHLDLSLARAGLTAQDIDIVIATHLHFDHAGGLTVLVDDVLMAHFPRARHVIRRGEWEQAVHPNERTRGTYLAENFIPLRDAGLIDFIERDEEVVPGVRVRRTGGHTAHHQMVMIEGGGRTAVFAADLLPTTAHLDPPWIMAYDLYPAETLEFKRAFLREAIREEYVIFFEHDPAVAAGIIREHDGRRSIEPVGDLESSNRR